MHRIYFISILLYSSMAYAVFNPTSGTPVWNIAAETGIITSAIEGTQTRIQQSDLSGGTYTINSAGRYAVVEDLTAPAGAITITINADNVYLDLNGFTIDGTGGSTAIISVASGRSHIYIGNGTLINATSTALDILANSSEVTIERIGIINSSGLGFQIQGTNCTLQQCSTTNSSSAGIALNTAKGIIIQDYTSYNDQTYGIDILQSQQIIITNVSIFASGTTGINGSDIQNINITNATINQNGDTGIELNDTTNAALQDIIINKPMVDGISLVGTTSAIAITTIDIFQPKGNGITIDESVSAICIANASIIGADSYGILLADSNYDIYIDAVDICNTTSHGFLCINPRAFNIPTIGPRISVSNGNVTESGGHGYFFYAADTTFEKKGIVIDACSATHNNGDGFRFDRSGSGASLFSYTAILNCSANSNLGNGFMLNLQYSLVKNNIAQYNLTNNMLTVYPLRNAIIGNTCANQAGGFNFLEVAAGSSNYDLYLNNCAGAGSNAIGTNYSLANSVITSSKTDIKGDGSGAPTNDELTFWVNISSSQS